MKNSFAAVIAELELSARIIQTNLDAVRIGLHDGDAEEYRRALEERRRAIEVLRLHDNGQQQGSER